MCILVRFLRLKFNARLRFLGMGRVECWKLSNVSAGIAITIFRMNMYTFTPKRSILRYPSPKAESHSYLALYSTVSYILFTSAGYIVEGERERWSGQLDGLVMLRREINVTFGLTLHTKTYTTYTRTNWYIGRRHVGHVGVTCLSETVTLII